MPGVQEGFFNPALKSRVVKNYCTRGVLRFFCFMYIDQIFEYGGFQIRIGNIVGEELMSQGFNMD